MQVKKIDAETNGKFAICKSDHSHSYYNPTWVPGDLFLIMSDVYHTELRSGKIEKIFPKGPVSTGEHNYKVDLIIKNKLTAISLPELYISEQTEKLAGKCVCFTGELEHPRKFWKSLVMLHGGEAVNSITVKNAERTILVTNKQNSKSTKTLKAQKIGVQILTASEFEKLLEL